jgi:low affinity Fe/Cu permease
LGRRAPRAAGRAHRGVARCKSTAREPLAVSAHSLMQQDPSGIGGRGGRALVHAHWMAHQAGKASTFIVALALLVVWAVTGPLFGWSDTWQLIINTGTTIITFLMVFLIQNTQNRDTEALHLKLDELIHATKGARDSAMELEDKSEEQLDAIKAELLKKPQIRRGRRTKGRGPQPPAKLDQS